MTSLLDEARKLPAVPVRVPLNAEDRYYTFALEQRLAIAVRALMEQADWLVDSGYEDGELSALADALEVKP